ncbi:hypothetical protein EVAR_88222_1 [Eumeta japonica]|uniref:Uncharacterized protein n=1 Tax=Eumeta variegata TaxID=151549 RepID=A0A4C1Z260_EUMVA|nr:hypothetical protein EVAR_88222_1 [Eumeta japonica]
MFQHSMTTIHNCHLLDLTLDNGERKIDGSRCEDLLPEDLCIPDNLYHYIASIGNTVTVEGEEIKFNLPDVAIPRAAEGQIPAGSFGPVNANNHNVYECYISLLVTSNRVLNTRRGPDDPEIPPLPIALIPEGAVPTPNLLGHGPADVLPAEAGISYIHEYKVKGELAEMDVKCNDLTDQRDRLQVLVSEMDDCRNHYEQSLLQIQVLQEELPIKTEQSIALNNKNASIPESVTSALHTVINYENETVIYSDELGIGLGPMLSGYMNHRSDVVWYLALGKRPGYSENFRVAEAGRSRNLQARTSYIP